MRNNQSSILKVENFYSAHLDNTRDLFIYLPPSYRSDRAKRYPVLYMHDGQNIFHPAFNGYSWNVHETADRLIQNGLMEEIIVVGIPNRGVERADEFTHELEGVLYPSDKVRIQPKGQLYECFIIEEVKPYIDALFRTKPDPEHTGLMGSSRGGQVTYHIGLRRPDIFGKLAILSPYFYYVDPVTLEEFRQYHTFGTKQPVSRIWIDLGGREGTLIMEKHVREVAEQLALLGYEADDELMYFFDPEAAHVEKDWATRLASPLLHLFGDKGQARSLSLQGWDEVGIHGPLCRLNAIAEFDSGLKMSLLRAAYRVENPRILEMQEDGTVVAKEEGETTVTVSYCGMEAALSIRVVKELKERVALDMTVHVPPHTPDSVTLYAWFPLSKQPDAPVYSGRLELPLHTEFVYQISRADGVTETDQDGKPVLRHYRAEADSRLELTVERWSNDIRED
ncbi:alpha/beta hydrolase [Paenibacillus oleatilyticus]|uniref:Alpha/beta hydrolase n=1 Tax=Paenibacillus oleatilyticus TaxID=2594886 RepID=A0ABV4UWZ7_9BACL